MFFLHKCKIQKNTCGRILDLVTSTKAMSSWRGLQMDETASSGALRG